MLNNVHTINDLISAINDRHFSLNNCSMRVGPDESRNYFNTKLLEVITNTFNNHKLSFHDKELKIIKLLNCDFFSTKLLTVLTDSVTIKIGSKSILQYFVEMNAQNILWFLYYKEISSIEIASSRCFGIDTLLQLPKTSMVIDEKDESNAKNKDKINEIEIDIESNTNNQLFINDDFFEGAFREDFKLRPSLATAFLLNSACLSIDEFKDCVNNRVLYPLFDKTRESLISTLTSKKSQDGCSSSSTPKPKVQPYQHHLLFIAKQLDTELLTIFAESNKELEAKSLPTVIVLAKKYLDKSNDPLSKQLYDNLILKIKEELAKKYPKVQNLNDNELLTLLEKKEKEIVQHTNSIRQRRKNGDVIYQNELETKIDNLYIVYLLLSLKNPANGSPGIILVNKLFDKDDPYFALFILIFLNPKSPECLTNAIIKDSPNSVQFLLQDEYYQGIINNQQYEDNKSKTSKTYRFLELAIRRGNLPIVKLLIQNGAKFDDFHPLREAILSDNLDMVKYLIDEGANINQTYDYCTPLQFAKKNNYRSSHRVAIISALEKAQGQLAERNKLPATTSNTAGTSVDLNGAFGSTASFTLPAPDSLRDSLAKRYPYLGVGAILNATDKTFKNQFDRCFLAWLAQPMIKTNPTLSTTDLGANNTTYTSKFASAIVFNITKITCKLNEGFNGKGGSLLSLGTFMVCPLLMVLILKRSSPSIEINPLFFNKKVAGCVILSSIGVLIINSDKALESIFGKYYSVQRNNVEVQI